LSPPPPICSQKKPLKINDFQGVFFL